MWIVRPELYKYHIASNQSGLMYERNRSFTISQARFRSHFDTSFNHFSLLSLFLLPLLFPLLHHFGLLSVSFLSFPSSPTFFFFFLPFYSLFFFTSLIFSSPYAFFRCFFFSSVSPSTSSFSSASSSLSSSWSYSSSPS